jgi:hypothetical protein
MAAKLKAAEMPRRAPVSATLAWESSPWFTPVAFVILLVALLLLFREFVFSNRMLDCSDFMQAGMFFRSFAVDYFKSHGAMAQWNPYIFGGLPHVDAFHGDLFYPLSIIKYALDTHRYFGFVLILHIYLAGIFMYLCARQFKLGKTAALLSAIIYMFAASMVSLVSPGHDGKMFVTALFPLALLFLDRGFEKKPFLNFTIFGLVVGVIILSPHVQMAYYSLWALALYTVFKLVFLYREKRQIMALARPGLLTCYGVLIGILLSMIQFYPGYNYTTNFSPRADSKRGWDWATSWSMHQEEAFGILVPEFAGATTKDDKSFYWGKNYFKDNSESSGAAGLLLALIAVFFAKRREAYFFAGLAVLALIYALGATTPIFRLFFYVIPLVKSLRAPSMIMFLFTFSVALLAGMALQHFIGGKRETGKTEKKFNYLLFGFPAFIGLIALLFSAAGRGMLSAWCSIFYSDASTTMVQQGVSKLDVAYMNLPQIQTGAWIAFLMTALVALFVWLYRNGKMGTGILLAVLCVPLADDMRFNSRFVGTVDPAQRWAPTPITQYLKQNANNNRAINLTNLNDDVLPYHGIEVVVGYHGNQLRWYDDLLGGPQLSTLQNSRKPFNPRFLNLIGAGYMIMPAQWQPQLTNYFGPKPLVEITSQGSSKLMRNDNAFPRAFLVSKYNVIADRKDITPVVLESNVDLRGLALLEEKPDIPVTADSASTDSAWVISHGIDTVAIGVSVTTNKLLVLTDVYYDSWQVTIDGRPARLLRVDGAFRAVAVPAGSRDVSFIYHSPRYTTGRMITWLTALYILCIIGGTVVMARRQKPAPATSNG